jgi:hypothetical protein
MVFKNVEKEASYILGNIDENRIGKYFQDFKCLLFICSINCKISQSIEIKRHGHDMLI